MATTRPYTLSIPNLQRIGNSNSRRFIRKNPEYEALIYCGFCNQYIVFHEHGYDYNPPWDPYDGYPSDAPSTD